MPRSQQWPAWNVADARGLATGRWMEAVTASMLRDNAGAAALALEHGASACTDVSGFGLAGHLDEMLSSSGVAADIDLSSLPLLPGALELTRRGLRSSFFEQNADRRNTVLKSEEVFDAPLEALLFDPQTSGGLLVGIESARAQGLVGALVAGGDSGARVIGQIADPGDAGPGIGLSIG